MLIGRENEMRDLQVKYEQDGFQFIAVYGRRRVGKTRLISEFVRGKRTVFYTASLNEPVVLLKELTAAIAEAFPEESLLQSMDSFPDFDGAFSFLAAKAKNERLVFVIDEYPYLARSFPAISSVIQRAIDGLFKKTQLYLILSGSSMSFMEKQIFDYQSPLYGRRTGQIKLRALHYYESIRFFPEWAEEEKLYAYGICGGIPQYLEIMARHSCLKEAVEQELLSTTGGLYDEPDFLLKEELREPAVYNGIIDAVAHGQNKVNEIASAIHKPANGLINYLKNLVSLEIIEKQMPVEETSPKKAIYVIKDPLFAFWYRFIPRCRFYITMDKNAEAYQERILPYLSDYFGHVFEDVCLQYIMKQTAEERISPIYDSYGRWWGSNPATKQQEDIDVVCARPDAILTGECKWTNEPVDFGIYNTLVERTRLIQNNRKPQYYLFSKAGFDEKLRQAELSELKLTLVNVQEILDA